MSEPTYYETMYILRPDIPEDEVENHLKKYSEVLEKAKSKVIDNQMRGKRRLAYTIGKHKEGVYVQLSHTGPGENIETLEKAMRLSEDVIRYLTVKQYGPIPTKKNTKPQDAESKSNKNDKELEEKKENNEKVDPSVKKEKDSETKQEETKQEETKQEETK
ncbi:30S ribosomal protein S6 [Prochlorococcus marinus]|uniref:30S ribosomal protein S6 n=1 Tax=Prochlorococcus marinus TaxID=1219 RepID=UPI0022B3398E|nr:30S ribosomal protein S6 [Prochlorococcus marinus]